MNVLQAIQGLTKYPVNDTSIELLCIERGIDPLQEVDYSLTQTPSFQLIKADYYMMMYGAVSIGEQDIQISVVERSNYYKIAQNIYGFYNDAKFQGFTIGHIGEDWNYGE